MSTNIQQSPYLRQQRNFPSDNIQALTVELDKAYVDTATKLNVRTIGTYAVNNPIVIGDQWYLQGQPQRQQVLRQVFQFTSSGSITHNINMATVSAFTRIYGTFTNGTNWYPLPYVDATSANNQVSISVSGTQIVISAGGGSPPVISSGFVVLEWLSQF